MPNTPITNIETKFKGLISAYKLHTPRKISLTSDFLGGDVLFDGSDDVTLTATTNYDLLKTNLGLGSAAYKNVPATSDASSTEVVLGSDSRLSDARLATKLKTPIKINDIEFDGSTDITIEDNTKVKLTDIGITVASLVNGKVPVSQLPEFAKSIIQKDSISEFPVTGETDKLYIDISTLSLYVWQTTEYVLVSKLIQNTDNLTEGTTNLYFTAARARNAVTSVETANKLSTARKIELSGNVIGSVNFDGSQDVNITTTLKDIIQGGTVGSTTEIPEITYDNSGRITSVKSNTISLEVLGALKSNSPITPNTSTKVTYDSKGLITSGTSLAESDIPNLSWNKITKDKPTTLSGYGITDAAALSHTHSLISLTDVTFNTINTGDIVQWNGSKFEVKSLTSAGIQPSGNYLIENQSINISGDVTGAGKTNIILTLNDTGVQDGIYTKVQVDKKGRVVKGITANTLADYGIIDALNKNLLGQKDGVAMLDGSGKIPASQLPSYVDDVLEFSSAQYFPVIGEIGKIYVDLESNSTYRWTGTQYISISSVNITSDSVPEGVHNLYFTATRARNAVTDITGNAGTADKLKTPRTITIGGEVAGSATFDGSSDININVTSTKSGVTPGTYGSNTQIPVITVDKTGRITDVITKTVVGGSGGGSSNFSELLDVNVSTATENDTLTYTNGKWSNTPQSIISKRFDFTNSLEWIVQHNMSTTKFVKTLFDNNNNEFSAKTTIIDSNSFKVSLTAKRSGYVNVIFGL